MSGQGKLLRNGATVYELMHAGWIKGKEVLKNKFSFRVYADKDAGVADEEIARRLVACWNRLLPFSMEEIESGIDLTKLMQDRDELLEVLRRQWKADRVLAEQPWDCTEEEHEKALDEHWSTHEAIKGILAKYPEAES